MNTRKILDLPISENPEESDYLILGKTDPPNKLERISLGQVISKRITYLNFSPSEELFQGWLYLIDTSTTDITVTLPEFPDNGNWVAFGDYAGSHPDNPTGFGLRTLTINPNTGHTIQNETSLILNQENQAVELAFWDSNWAITFATV